MKLGARSWVALAGAVATYGCASVLGVSGYEPVECVRDCTFAGDGEPPSSSGGEGGARLDAATDRTIPPSNVDASEVTEASTDASACTNLAPCANNGSRVAVRIAPAPAVQISSSPSGIEAREGQTASACFPSGTSIRLRTSNGNADFRGVSCSNGNIDTDRCDFIVSGDVCIDVAGAR